MPRLNDFSRATKEEALWRQKSNCASCGERISSLALSGAGEHRFGEAAHAHHMRHARAGGTDSVENCVVICQSCHYSAHEGGNYRHGSVIDASPHDFPHYYG